MECLELRRRCEIDPNDPDPALAAHARSCSACARHLERAKRFDALVEEALRVNVSTMSLPGRPRSIARLRLRWMAAAASFVLAVGLFAGLWFGVAPKPALASRVVEHILDEPRALQYRPAIDSSVIRNVLAPGHVQISEDIGPISYVRLCPFGDLRVPHFVVETPSGPITVMVLQDERLPGVVSIELAGFVGRIVPAGSGSIVIVRYDRPVDATEQRRIVEAVSWEA